MRKMSQEYQYLQTLATRIQLTTTEQQSLTQLQKGYHGEQILDTLQETLTQTKLPCIDDFYLKTNTSCVQIDKLLVVAGVAYVIDVKNYKGLYTYSQNEWLRNDIPLQENIFEQLHHAMRAVRRIFLSEKVSLEVRGVLVFIDPQATIDIQENVNDVVLTYQEIAGWLLQLASQVQPKDYAYEKNWRQALRKQTLAKFPSPRKLPLQQLAHLKHGICCRNCGDNHLTETSFYMECCHCHHREPKETAYVRTICDCGVLFHDRELTIGMLCQFFGESVNRRYLKEMLARHFEVKRHSGSTCLYYNQEKLFIYWFSNKMDYFKGLEKRITWTVRTKRR
ncbi:MAG TPA: NERD domain-containing protein [Candidatus Tetragenococcus pullicola]|nr:NERD domain-containing protein [Candidatus Tetragenococcus pullicola]